MVRSLWTGRGRDLGAGRSINKLKTPRIYRRDTTACTLKAVNNALFPKWFSGVKTARLISPKPLLVGEDAFQ